MPDANESEVESESGVTWCRWVQHSESSYAPCGTCVKLDTFEPGQAYVWFTVNCYVCSSLAPGTTGLWREISHSCQPRIPGAVGCARC